MALTFSPDPPHLLEGAGTAAEQAARPRMFADHVNGGWTDGSTVVPPGLSAFPAGQSWGIWVWPVSTVDFGDGQSQSPFLKGLHTYPADGPYTITATSEDGRTVQTLVIHNRADQSSAPPTLTTVTPDSIAFDDGVATVTLDGAGFTAADKVMVQVYNTNQPGRVVPSTFVSATQLTCQINPLVAGGRSTLQVWVVAPDGKATDYVMVGVTYGPPPGPPYMFVQAGRENGAQVFVNPPSAVDWGDGNTDQGVVSGPHTYAADGAYTIVATAPDTTTQQTVFYARADQLTGPPSLTGVTPDTATAGSAPFTVTLDGAGFTATSKVSLYYPSDDTSTVVPYEEIVPTFVSAAQLTFEFDPTGHVAQQVNVWVTNDDGKATVADFIFLT